MNISGPQYEYLEKRKKLTSAWRFVGPALLLAILGLAMWIYLRSPLLINPYEAISRMETGHIEKSTLEMMATVLPIVMIIVFLLLLSIVGIMYAAFSKEKKYMEIIGKLNRERPENRR